MIKIAIKENDGQFNEITINGHAKYDESGRDIVCAAVSSIVITSINGIMRLNYDAIDYMEADDEMKIIMKKADDIINTLLFNMVELLEELKTQYPNNIEIRRCKND